MGAEPEIDYIGAVVPICAPDDLFGNGLRKMEYFTTRARCATPGDSFRHPSTMGSMASTKQWKVSWGWTGNHKDAPSAAAAATSAGAGSGEAIFEVNDDGTVGL